MKSWKIIVWIVILGGIGGGIGWFAFGFYHCVYVTVPNCYAVSWLAYMVIDYMEANDGEWPKEWEDLRKPYEAAAKRAGRPWTFESLRARVEIDWTVDPHVLAEVKSTEDGPPFRVIWLRDGSSVHWNGQEPNQLVWKYLQERRKIKEKAPSENRN